MLLGKVTASQHKMKLGRHDADTDLKTASASQTQSCPAMLLEPVRRFRARSLDIRHFLV
jgi:hypothetical protein